MKMTKRALLAQTQYHDVVGLRVDYENASFERLAAARGRTAGADFDCFPPFGGRRRCCAADNGAVNAFYGETGYAEDGTNGQVMVYQPKFYYRVAPRKLTAAACGTGYVMQKADYFISAAPKPGFRLHPAFYGSDGNAVDHVLLSAYEASYYDASLNGYFTDGTDSDAAIDYTADRLCSVAGKKPISGLTKNLTRANAGHLAAARGTGWHIDTIKTCAANQLLMMVELGTMNTQSALGSGISAISDLSGTNCASLTGSTASLGNASGAAAATVNEKNGTTITLTGDGKTAVSYRGMENPWGNLWKTIDGINVYGDGASAGGEVFIADDFGFTEDRNSDNYRTAGLTLAPTSGFITAMAYGGPSSDWLLLPGLTGSRDVSPVGDYATVVANTAGYRLPILGGRWSYGDYNGGFYMGFSNRSNYYGSGMGCRLVYIP